jgi:hypothetical protein
MCVSRVCLGKKRSFHIYLKSGAKQLLISAPPQGRLRGLGLEEARRLLRVDAQLGDKIALDQIVPRKVPSCPVRPGPAREKRPIFSTFPMFVPSLSWQDGHF